MGKTTKTAPKRTAPQRPVIAMRVHDRIWKMLKNAAASNRNSMSSEAERRIDQSFEWDRAIQTVGSWKMKQETAIKEDLRAALAAAGYQLIKNARGRVWAEPGVDFDASGISPEAIEEVVERAVLKAMAKVKR